MARKSDLTKDRLLEAAARVATRAGYGGLTLEAVAAEAGTSKGGLLYHFASKELLVAAMVDRMSNQFEQARAAIMAADPTRPGCWTRSFVQASCAETEEDTELASCLIAAVALNPDLLNPLRERYATWLSALEADGIATTDAHIVRLAVDGLWLCSLLGLGVPNAARQQDIRARLLELAAAPPATARNRK